MQAGNAKYLKTNKNEKAGNGSQLCHVEERAKKKPGDTSSRKCGSISAPMLAEMCFLCQDIQCPRGQMYQVPFSIV